MQPSASGSRLLPLQGATALVTGAARGLGRAIALELAAQGADVAVNDRPGGEGAEAVAAEIRALARRSRVVPADVSREDDVLELFDRVAGEFGGLDILVNNAGTARAQDIFETSLTDWQAVLDTNLTSCFLCSRAAMEAMRPRGAGRIVNISSVVAHRGALFGHVHYAATKSGILGFTKTLARTAAPLGITVNAVAPGIIDTELLRKTHGAAEIESLAASVPLGLGRPEDVALAVAFLCGPGGRYITGATLDVNGGMYLR